MTSHVSCVCVCVCVCVRVRVRVRVRMMGFTCTCIVAHIAVRGANGGSTGRMCTSCPQGMALVA